MNEFGSYNFLSCYDGKKETIFWKNGKVKGETYYLNNDKIKILRQTIPEFDDAYILFNMGYKVDCDWNKVVTHIRKAKPKKLIVFNDDAHTSLDPEYGFSPNLTHEGIVISDIIAKLRIKDYVIYDCEYNTSIYYEDIPRSKLRYYDIFTQTWVGGGFDDYEPQETFDWKVCCTNKKPDIHRLLAVMHLCDDPSFKGTYHDMPRKPEMVKMISYTNTHQHYKPPQPTFMMLSEEYKNKILDERFQIFTEAYLNNDLFWDSNDHEKISGEDQIKTIEITGNSFLTLVAETLWDTRTQFWSEKTLKPMYMLRPFIILASPGSLSLIRRLGFRTFSQWWDESYDEEIDHGKRFEKVMKIVDDIRSLSDYDLHDMLIEMKSVLDHNRKHAIEELHKVYLI